MFTAPFARPLPLGAVTTPAETITLIPYGATLLRVAEFPQLGGSQLLA